MRKMLCRVYSKQVEKSPTQTPKVLDKAMPYGINGLLLGPDIKHMTLR